MHILSLDLVSVQLTNPVGETPVEIVRVAQWRGPMLSTHEICEALAKACRKNYTLQSPDSCGAPIFAGSEGSSPLWGPAGPCNFNRGAA
jgi:hypothetical protein